MTARLFLFSCFVFVFILAAQPAQAGLVEFFFPSLRKQEVDPAQTLQAPFASGGPVKKDAMGPQAVRPLPENSIPMAQPHRSTAQITEWVIMVVSEAMTFDKDDVGTSLASTGKYFNETGRAQYDQFLKDSKLANVLDSNKYYVRSYVRDAPILLNEGTVGGYYRWLYEVPVMVSYMARTDKDYKKASPVNQQVLVTVQVGRSPRAVDPAGIVVETWGGKAEKFDKK